MHFLKLYENFEPNNITEIINDTVIEYMTRYNETPYEINDGHCDVFACDVINKMGGYKDNLYELSDDMIYNLRDPEEAKEIWNGEIIETEYGVWSKNMLDLYGYPPIPLNDINDEGSHVWIFYNGKHYDAECSKGVNKWVDLPIFKKLF